MEGWERDGEPRRVPKGEKKKRRRKRHGVGGGDILGFRRWRYRGGRVEEEWRRVRGVVRRVERMLE